MKVALALLPLVAGLGRLMEGYWLIVILCRPLQPYLFNACVVSIAATPLLPPCLSLSVIHAT